MPIINPSEYPDLKARGLIRLVKQASGKIRVTIDRGEQDEYTKATILAWLAAERLSLTNQVAVLDAIKADVDPL